MRTLKVFAVVAMGLLVGGGLVFLIIKNIDRLTDLMRSVKKHGFLKLELGVPNFARISEAAAEDCEQAFRADYAAEPSPQGEPAPNPPTEE
jgi:hypothetical protein